ncbi:MAG TPA: chromate transporter [Rhodocyclaceae bacterium]|nr:chromate transporter [Rhodocyclaceae bacterium]
MTPGRAPTAVSLGELFRGFCLIGLSGFGGVMPWARRYIVERYHWLEPEEFAALLGLGQVMPGPNVMNLSVCVGQKFQGWRGAIVAPLGMMLFPMVIVLMLGLAYLRFGDQPVVHAVLRGIIAVGAGLIIATGLKMLYVYKRRPLALAIALAIVIAVGVLRLSLLPVVAVVLTFGIALEFAARRR